MDREKLYQFFDRNYIPRRGVLPRLPLGVNPDEFWREILSRRKARSTPLPLHGAGGIPYWYVTTDAMVAASEKIVEEFMGMGDDAEPFRVSSPLSPLEEIFYTSYVEGSQMTMQAAMAFLQTERPPQDIEEQMITNNRNAIGFAGANLYQPLEERFIQTLAYILTENMDGGGQEYRALDSVPVPSMMGEPYELPAAAVLPDRMREFTAFLADPCVHPLIKAGTAQAWTLAVRPFGEGDERLGRLLSTMILHRAGYAFFGEVSLSSLIAKNGYPYYDAVANILRKENSGDLTYFLEHYLRLLAQAVDVRRKRIEQRSFEAAQAERVMAGTVLSREMPDRSEDFAPAIVAAPAVPAFTVPSPPEAPSPIEEDLDGFVSLEGMADAGSYTEESHAEETEGEDLPPEGGELRAHWSGEFRFREIIRAARWRSHNGTRACGEALVQYLEEERLVFTARDIAEDIGVKPKIATGYMARFTELGALVLLKNDGRRNYYTFGFGPDPLTEEDYSPEYIRELRGLTRDTSSTRDIRLGRILLSCLPAGCVTLDDYIANGNEARWRDDMKLAEQMGLVIRVTDERCNLYSDAFPRFDRLDRAQKRRATEMYETFGEETFSLEMVVATLDYDSNTASTYLHRFQLLKILDCRKEDVYLYQFLVNPRENPECFLDAA